MAVDASSTSLWPGMYTSYYERRRADGTVVSSPTSLGENLLPGHTAPDMPVPPLAAATFEIETEAYQTLLARAQRRTDACDQS